MKKNTLKLSVLSAAIMFSLMGCGGSDSKAPVSKKVAVDNAPIANNVDISIVQHWEPISGQLDATDSDGDALIFSFSENEKDIVGEDGVYTFSHGELKVSGLEYTYVSSTGENTEIAYTVTANGKSASAKITVSFEDEAPTVSDAEITGIKHWVAVAGTFDAADTNGDPLSFSFSENGKEITGKEGVYTFSHGKLTLSGLDYSYVSLSGMEAEIDYTVSAFGKSASAKLTISDIASDPLAEHQWHLNNTGQNAFAVNRGVSGEDINVAEAMSLQALGQGITVAVVDDGLEISHPDLKNNTVPGGSYNLITGTVDPTPFADGSAHGTAVAGIIAAEGWNNIGGRGVAPEAKLIGFNFLDSDPTGAVENVQTFENFAKSHGASAFSDNARVFNQSYGYSIPFPDSFEVDDNEVYAETTLESFDGKGSIFLKSAGNGYKYYRFGGTYYIPGDYWSAEGEANKGMPFNNSNIASPNANVYNLVVSAINAEGKLSSYSSVGANVFMTAPGGEYGQDNPAIVTTDRAGCEKGYAITEDRPSTPFHGGQHPLNQECDYASTMNGTSSAAPNASGAVAVIMSANPELTWRDVRHILAGTATKVDTDIEAKSVTIGDAEDAAEYVAIPQWEVNAAGYQFHNFYGFGRVNVGEAVKAAKNYSEDLGEYVLTDWLNVTDLSKDIPDASLVGVSDDLTVEDDLIIEAVQIELTADHLRLPDLAVELISPAGTKSVMMTPYNGLVYQGIMDARDPDDFVAGYDSTPMLSNAFYGESSKGEWTIKLIDVNSGDYTFVKYDAGYIDIPNEAKGMLKGWSIRFHGHAAQTAL